MPEDRQDRVESVSTDASGAGNAPSLSGEGSGAKPYATLEELGAALAGRRAEQGLNVADVAARLMLAVPVVEAMENGQIAQKRPAVYARGFLRAYAQAVRMPKDLYEPLLASLAEDRTLLEKPYFSPDKTARLPHSSPVWGILASLLVTVCAVWLLWHFNVLDHLFKMKETVTPTAVPMQNYEAASKEPVPQADAAKDAARDSSKDVSSTGVSGDSVVQPVQKDMQKDVQKGQPAPAGEFNGTLLPGNMQKPVLQETVPGGSGRTAPAGSPSQSLAPDRPETSQEYLPAVVPPNSPWAALQGNATLAGEAGMASQAPAAAQPANPNLPDQSQSQAQGVVQNGKHTVTITAEALCWTQVTADSGRPAQRTLQPGESMSVPFDTSLTLRLGNAGGVKVFYDGIEQTDRGRVGQVRTLNFPPAPVE